MMILVWREMRPSPYSSSTLLQWQWSPSLRKIVSFTLYNYESLTHTFSISVQLCPLDSTQQSTLCWRENLWTWSLKEWEILKNQLLPIYLLLTELLQVNMFCFSVRYVTVLYSPAFLDYIQLDELQVTFNPGEFIQRIPVSTVPDTPAEGDETFFANLSPVNPAVGVFEPEATIIITENGVCVYCTSQIFFRW